MLDAAVQFWATAAQDTRVSAAFRTTCVANAQVLEQWGGLGLSNAGRREASLSRHCREGGNPKLPQAQLFGPLRVKSGAYALVEDRNGVAGGASF